MCLKMSDIEYSVFKVDGLSVFKYVLCVVANHASIAVYSSRQNLKSASNLQHPVIDIFQIGSLFFQSCLAFSLRLYGSVELAHILLRILLIWFWNFLHMWNSYIKITNILCIILKKITTSSSTPSVPAMKLSFKGSSTLVCTILAHSASVPAVCPTYCGTEVKSFKGILSVSLKPKLAGVDSEGFTMLNCLLLGLLPSTPYGNIHSHC